MVSDAYDVNIWRTNFLSKDRNTIYVAMVNANDNFNGVSSGNCS